MGVKDRVVPWINMLVVLCSFSILAGCGCNPDDQDNDGDGFSPNEGDCDDEFELIYPGAPESCNGLDDDCDAQIDEDFDSDSDGYLDLSLCADGTDCDDTDALISPDATEVCDGLDNDCNGTPDDGLKVRQWCEDNDGDGFGSATSIDICDEQAPIGYVECKSEVDCDDSAGTVFPGATEICDQLDNDCNGLVDEDPSLDADGDGYPWCQECDDTAPWMNPGLEEVCDAFDNDCDGVVAPSETDDDGDGWVECSPWVPNGAFGIFGGEDCDDGAGGVYPGAAEICDGINQDCDELIDEDFDLDSDGHFDELNANCVATYVQLDLDCDESAYTVYYGAPEVCDDTDNDCDGLEDDDDPDYAGDDGDNDGEIGEPCGGPDCNDGDPLIYDTWSADSDGISPCDGDCNDLNPYVKPNQNEACDGEDTDCDGLIDDADLDLDPDWDGDGHQTSGCGVGGTDCDDRDAHVFEASSYSSGMVSSCMPAVYPGFDHEWHYGRISLPSYFYDDTTGTHYLYYRGHQDKNEQQFGVSSSSDGVTWTASPDPILADRGDVGAWDGRGISNPAVAHIPGLLRPYVMLYHAQAPAGSLRQIGLATATDPLGPFDRLDPNSGFDLADNDNDGFSDPVLSPSADPNALDSSRTLHPSIYFDGTDLHVWYNGRQGSPNTLRVFHAMSSDGGVTWTKTDSDGNGVDSVFEPSQAWHGSSVSQVSWLEDPFTAGEFEFWYTGASTQVGYTTGTATSWDPTGYLGPVLAANAECTRLDGEAVSARGIQYNSSNDSYSWYYGAQTDIRDPVVDGGTCQENWDNILADPYYNNGGYISYVSQGTNWAPVVTMNQPATPGADMVFDGTISDTAPDDGLLLVTLSSDQDGFLGTATIGSTGNSDPGVQSTTWSLSVTGLTAGAHEVTAEAVDAAGTVRSDLLSVTIP
ncbi:MAG: MopE-related protein [Myxococcota bacterium]|nr:MopE-related protein [Myxococcota bacterium]